MTEAKKFEIKPIYCEYGQNRGDSVSKAEEIFTIQLTSNKDEVLKAAAEQIYIGLASIGEEAEGHAKSECPTDTGRLKNSITYATKMEHSSGNEFEGTAASEEDTKPQATPDEFTVYIGTNVEYAMYVEYNDNAAHDKGKAHFLRDAISNHTDRYRSILEAALKAGG